jgi:hypothetical protein
MKKFLITAVGIVMLIAVSVSPSLFSQVNGEYKSITIVENQTYTELAPNKTVIPNTAFALGPNYIQEDSDDGYFRVNLGFDFEMNGEVFNQAWIGVNGFITLTPPPFLPAKNVNALFLDANNYPVNVIAPFWGDHYYRDAEDFFTNGFVISEISYKVDTIDHGNGVLQRVFVVQWKDLNINFRLGNENVKSSVANFQLRLYESLDAFSYQGDIEFAYGTVGPTNRPDITDTRVITSGSVVGIKGEGKLVGEGADFLNGLFYDQSIALAGTRQDKTTSWQPSGGSDKRILFTASSVFNVAEWWGDGDVDFSKARGNKHFGMPQSRFVTANDVRLIMKSVASNIPLDPVRRRQAYHGDVNHNGRYYFANNGSKVKITKKSKVFTDDLPNEISSTKQVLFEANEHDASYILAYMAGKVVELPWLIDTVVQWGKLIDDSKANNIRIGDVVALGNSEYQIAVYVNGSYAGPLSAKYTVNGKILDIVKNETEDNQMLVVSSENNIVLSAQGTFDAANPVMIIKVATDAKNLNISNIRFNDNETGDLNVNLSNVENNDNSNNIVNVTPNVVTDRALVSINITNDGYYELAIYDMQGNLVSKLANADMKAGSYVYNWDAKNLAGSNVANGMYVYRLSGAGVNASGKVAVSK